MRAVVEAAKAGDMRAADILLKRLWPERKGRPVLVDLPPLDTPAGIVSGLTAVARAVGAGDLSPEEGQAVAAILEGQRRALETMDLEARLAALEAAAKGVAA
jgi:Xaa-Pro aminopeptidase